MFFSRQQHHLCFPCIKTLLPVLNTFFALIVLAGCGNSSPSRTAKVSLDAETFDFGNNLVNNTLTRKVVTVSNTGSSVLTIRPALSGDASFSIASTGSCGQQLAPGTQCDLVVNYSPTAPSFPSTQNATLNLGLGGVPADTHQVVAITGTAAAMTPGQVSATNNPQVALYTLVLPFPGTVSINFGTDTNYGLKTWSQASGTDGKASIFVAGMRASTAYHMQAQVVFSNGITAHDVDHAFTTSAIPAAMQINLTTTTTGGRTPQSGLELLNPLSGTPSGIVVTDLSGNILWTYANPSSVAQNFINGVKLLPNGNILMAIGMGIPYNGAIPTEAVNEIREVNLVGDTIRSISVSDLNTGLVGASCGSVM